MLPNTPYSFQVQRHSFYARPPAAQGRRRLSWGAQLWVGHPVPQAEPAGAAGPRGKELEEDERPYESASLSTTGFPFPASYLSKDSIYSYWRRVGRGVPAADSAQQAECFGTGAISGSGAPAAAAPPAGDLARTSRGIMGAPNMISTYPGAAQYSRTELSLNGASDGASGSGSKGSLSPLSSLELVPEEGAGEGGGSAAAGGPVRTVFRAAPYSAELAQQRQGLRDTVRILFLDEGNSCRAVLAVAVMQYMLGRLRAPLNIQVESASIGWAAPGPHDPRVARIAQEMALPLQPRTAREFDELEDIVQYDLVLVMDSFDLEEVMREVAMLERINPQGLYSTRVRRLGGFGAASLRVIPGQLADDLPDPLYGSLSSAAELASLRAAVHRIAFACRGLVHCLAQLRARSGPGMGLRRALAVSLQCPLLCPGVMQGRERLTERWRPVWQEKGQLYTIRWSGQQRRVVRRCTNGKPRGYWRDPANVEYELREWMSSQPSASPDRLPTQQQLRDSGANTLAAAIQAQGGLAEFSRRLGLPLAVRHPNGHWEDFANLERELQPFLTPLVGAVARPGTGTGTGAEGARVAAALPQRPGARRLLAAAAPARQQQEQQAVLAFPKQQQLVAAGRLDLVYAIRQHGGRAEVARRMGAVLAHNHLSSPEAVCKELLRFVEQKQQAARPGGRRRGLPPGLRSAVGLAAGAAMPTKPELYMAGRSDLAQAIKRFGGFHYFAGLTRLKEGGEATASETAGAAGAGTAGGSPAGAPQWQPQLSQMALTVAGAPVARRPSGGGARYFSYSTAQRSGSSSSVGVGGAEPLLRTQDGSLGDGSWALVAPSSWSEVHASSAATAVAAGDRGLAPAHALASRPGRSVRAATMGRPGFVPLPTGGPGGSMGSTGSSGAPSASHWAPAAAPQPQAQAVVRGASGGGGGGLGLPPSPSQLAVGSAVLEFMEREGMDTLPSRQALLQAGRRDLANAVQRCGGGRRLADHLGLEFEERRGRKPKHAREASSRLPPRPESALEDGFVLV